MKKRSPVLILNLALCIVSAYPSAAQQAGSASMTRWHPPALDLTKGEEPKPAPLTTVLGSLQISADPNAVDLNNNLTGIVVSVHNGTDRPVVVDMDKCTAQVFDTKYNSADSADIDEAVRHKHTFAHRAEWKAARIAIAAATIGAYQTVTDIEIQKGPVLKRYGVDEQRRQVEEQTFGARVVWPGETSKGIVYFPADSSLHGAALTVPVQALFDATDQAILKFTF